MSLDDEIPNSIKVERNKYYLNVHKHFFNFYRCYTQGCKSQLIANNKEKGNFVFEPSIIDEALCAKCLYKDAEPFVFVSK